MKYTKLFNKRSEYIAYTGSTDFITPNVSWCIKEQEAHCTPKVIVLNPVITCTGDKVTLTCSTVDADIYYRLNKRGSYSAYTAAISITADTIVEAYAELSGVRTEIVSEKCIYSHDFSLDYLTLKALSDGTILWLSRNNVSKTISYSKDNGETWTEITASSTGTPINVVEGDKVLLKGNNDQYATGKDNCSGFSGGTALYNVEGNIMSLISGDNFTQATVFTKTWVFHDLFAQSNVVSAKNLILPVMSLTTCCYRAMFSKASYLEEAPELPATTLAASAYTYMFDVTLIKNAPELLASTVPASCYQGMFQNCSNLSYIRCMATNISATNSTYQWVQNVSANGAFVKDSSISSWTVGDNGIPTGWVTYDDEMLYPPTIECDENNNVIITCKTSGTDIYYRLNEIRGYSAYTDAFSITADIIVDAYSVKNGVTSITSSHNCIYISTVPIEYSNRNLEEWTYNYQTIKTPYSVNAIDGHSGSYAKGNFSFETNFALREEEPTYLWFQHADQSASIYVDNELVEKHWGGYTAFFTDISDYVHSGTNNIKVTLKNNEGNNLAPAYGDFNFNATLGNVRLFTSPYLPSMNYGYDGFHVTSQFEYSDTARTTASAATISIKTSIPTGATVSCIISSGASIVYSATSASTGEEMTFTTPSLTGTNLHLWDGTIDPFLYTITLEIYHGQDLYHRYIRDYGLRYYEYLINDTTRYGTVSNPFTGFKLNGKTYLLRGVCMHDDLANKANALNDSDYTQEFSIIQELGCNFVRLAHYPHPKEVYDWCDRLGIVVQTEAPCVNKMDSTMGDTYYNNLTTQYTEMVNQYYNHPCILFWGLSNETTTDDVSFAKAKIEEYAQLIKNLDSERLVGYVMSHSVSDPYGYYNSPNGIDWLGGNIYVGWYINQDTNNPTTELNKRVTSTITNKNKALAFSEYGAGGTQNCHSDDFMTTTTSGNNPRHDIEYQMWLHEGHIEAIKNFPQLLFTSQWQLFDIAVSSRNEGYTVCLDGENTITDDNLKYLNNKGLVERDHITKKDTFYLYKAWWNSTPFVHICGKNYTKTSSRVIKCYTNDGSLSLYVNNTFIETVAPTNNIVTFASRNFDRGDIIRVEGSTTNDTFTFE